MPPHARARALASGSAHICTHAPTHTQHRSPCVHPRKDAQARDHTNTHTHTYKDARAGAARDVHVASPHTFFVGPNAHAMELPIGKPILHRKHIHVHWRSCDCGLSPLRTVCPIMQPRVSRKRQDCQTIWGGESSPGRPGKDKAIAQFSAATRRRMFATVARFGASSP